MHNLEGKGRIILKMVFEDFLLRIERGCANCATAVSNGTLGDLRYGILLF